MIQRFSPRSIWLLSILILVGIGGGALAYGQSQREVVNPTPTPTPQSQNTATFAPASATPLAVQPQGTEEAVVKQFYTYFAEKNKISLLALFTAPETQDEKALFSLLKDGVALDGTPGGPTLFESVSASGVVISYKVSNTTKVAETTTYTVEEVVDYAETSDRKRTRLLIVTQVNGKYLVQSYKASAEDTRYSGFLN